MIQRRTRDRGHFRGHNPELMIFIAIIGILAAIAIPQFLKALDSRATKCLGFLIAATDKGIPADTKCPKSGKVYAVARRDGLEIAACPAPEKHLDTAPTFERPKDGAWKLSQSLPAYQGGAIELGPGRTVVVESPGRLSLHLLPSKLNRHYAGPLFLTLTSVILLFSLGILIRALVTKNTDEMVGSGFMVVAFGIMTWMLVGGLGESTEFILERERVTRVDYHLGSARKRTVYERCLGLVPATPTAGSALKLFLVHAPDAGGNRVTEVSSVEKDRLDIVARLNRTLQGH